MPKLVGQAVCDYIREHHAVTAAAHIRESLILYGLTYSTIDKGGFIDAPSF